MEQVKTLVPGQNCVVPQETLTVEIKSNVKADLSAFRLYENGKTKQDDDFVFYGQPETGDKTIAFEDKSNSGVFVIKLDQIAADVTKIALCVTTLPEQKVIARLGSLDLTITQNGSTLVECPCEDIAQKQEAALIYGELYRHKDTWKFRFVSQGFLGGLAALAQNYGVDIADEGNGGSSDAANSSSSTANTSTLTSQPSSGEPAPAQGAESNPESSSSSPSKVILTKKSSTVNLKKSNSTPDHFRVNLNWHRGSSKNLHSLFSNSFSSANKGFNIDLDLGAYVKLKDGRQTLIQALGGDFGSLTAPPYVQLLGDDRTGEQQEGEWLMISPKHTDQLAEVIIFAFIYEGVPNWGQTDGVVKIQISGQPEVETRLTEGDDSKRMCAIARIIFDRDDIKVERLDRYFDGHRSMDHYFGWNFLWEAARK